MNRYKIIAEKLLSGTRRYAPGALLLLLAACQQPTTFAPRVSDAELQREASLQQQMVDKAAEDGGAPRPWRNRPGISKQFERVADRIDKAGAELCKEMGLPKQQKRCYYYFALSRSRELNAHADGKTVVIYNGMMRFLQDDDEVAIVTAHELAHNLMAHVDAQRDNALAGALVGAVLDGLAGTRGGWSDTGSEVGKLSYSVEFEQEADYVGLYIASRAGYDIRKAPDLWRRVTIEDPQSLFYAYDHPSNAARSAALGKAVDEIAYKRAHALPLIPEFKTASSNR